MGLDLTLEPALLNTPHLALGLALCATGDTSAIHRFGFTISIDSVPCEDCADFRKRLPTVKSSVATINSHPRKPQTIPMT